MNGILFLAHRVPFPPDRGDRIRSYHVLKALAELAPVHVGCLAENDAERGHVGALAKFAATHIIADRSKWLPLAGVEAVLRRRPVSMTAFHDRRLAEWVAETLARNAIDTIYVFSGQMGQYVPANWRGRTIADLVDVDSAKFEAYAAARSWPASVIHRREGRMLRIEEARIAALANQVLLVSEAEAALLRSRVPDAASSRIRAMGNGIDAQFFDPAAVAPDRDLKALPGPHLVFTGQMDYPPNVAACLRVVRSLMPKIRQRYPDAAFHIVGRAPTEALLACNGLNGCRIWGEVADVRPFLAAADLVLAPLTIARGIQNKVLEAMAMARPVLLTPEAATGIAARSGEHFTIARGDGELADCALAMLDDSTGAAAMGRSARAFVVQEMSWPAMLADLPMLVGANARAAARRDAA